MPEEALEEQEIPFTDELAEKIRKGEKQTTLRTIKKDNLYRVGESYWIAPDLKVKVTMREVITLGYEQCEAFDEGSQLFPNTPANHDALSKLEGFDGIGEMFEWFESRGYNLPQQFFMYRLNPIEIPETETKTGGENQ